MSQQQKNDIQRLAHKRPGVVRLPDPSDPDPIPTRTGLGQRTRAGGTGIGISWPLTEDSRTTYATKSSDGLFTWSVPNVITFVDANGTLGDMILAQP